MGTITTQTRLSVVVLFSLSNALLARWMWHREQTVANGDDEVIHVGLDFPLHGLHDI